MLKPVDFIDKNLNNVRFVKVNSLPAARQHLTSKLNIDGAINNPTLVRSNEQSAFNNHF